MVNPVAVEVSKDEEATKKEKDIKDEEEKKENKPLIDDLFRYCVFVNRFELIVHMKTK